MKRLLFSRANIFLRARVLYYHSAVKLFLISRSPFQKFSAILPLVYAINSVSNVSKEILNSIQLSDELFAAAKFKESYEVLVSHKNLDDDEVLWRLSRGLYNMVNEEPMSASEKKDRIIEADEYMKRALALNDKNYAVHKWCAIILDAKSSQEGTKAKINSLPTFEHHIKKAIELNPQDATSLHMLGAYYYNIADLPWYQKKIAATLFGKVPEASFQEALIFYNKAEEVNPNFYSTNLLMLGKTYLKLDMTDSAKHWLQRAAESDAKTEADKAVKKEATDLLKELKQ